VSICGESWLTPPACIDPTGNSKFLHSHGIREGLFIRACRNRMRRNGFKLEEGRFRLDIKKKFFTERIMRCSKTLPRDVVGAPSLEVLNIRLDGALSNLI